jgi:hypothetical protein
LTSICVVEKAKPELVKADYHFTIVDLKPAAIARDLVMLMMLRDVDSSPNKEAADLLLATIFYTFIAPCMPSFAYDILQSYITQLLGILQGQETIPSFLSLPKMHNQGVKKILRQWHNEVAATYSVANIRKLVQKGCNKERGQADSAPYVAQAPPFCQKEEHFYMRTAILFPPPSQIAKSELVKEREAFVKFNPRTNSTIDKAMLDHVDKTWKVNVTMIDLAWEKSRGGWGTRVNGVNVDVLDMNHDPFELIDHLLELYFGNRAPASASQTFVYWFTMIAKSITTLQSRLHIEAIPGEIMVILEQIRYGLVGHRLPSHVEGALPHQQQADTTEVETTAGVEYPYGYHKIHLSNIPDSTGGSLPVSLYALPITTPDESSLATFCN